MIARHPLSAVSLLLSFSAFLSNSAQAQNVFVGDSVALGDGFAFVWIETDGDNVPVRVGFTLDHGLLSDLPGQEQQNWLEFPDAGEHSLWKVVLFDWNPTGHEPSVYEEAHFDFHFAIVPRALMDAISNGAHMDPVAPELIPPGYEPSTDPPLAVANMGVHYFDKFAREWQGDPFTETLIYGYYQGEFLFMEPMITRVFLLAGKTDTLAIKQPKTFATPGYYPTNYAIEFDKAANLHHIVLIDFVFRAGATTAVESQGQLPGIVSLHQSFPNPARVDARIQFELSASVPVELEIFDLLGRSRKLIVDNTLAPGLHEVRLDVTDLEPGVYFYRLSAGSFQQIRPMQDVR